MTLGILAGVEGATGQLAAGPLAKQTFVSLNDITQRQPPSSAGAPWASSPQMALA